MNAYLMTVHGWVTHSNLKNIHMFYSFILNYVIKYHLHTFQPDYVSDALLNNFYVDNFVYSHNSEQVLAKLFHESVTRMQEGGFDLRSWNSNSPLVKKQILVKGK